MMYDTSKKTESNKILHSRQAKSQRAEIKLMLLLVADAVDYYPEGYMNHCSRIIGHHLWPLQIQHGKVIVRLKITQSQSLYSCVHPPYWGLIESTSTVTKASRLK